MYKVTVSIKTRVLKIAAFEMLTKEIRHNSH